MSGKLKSPSMARPDIRPLLDALGQRFGEALQTGQSIRDIHGRDESFCDPAAPDAVLFATSAEDVSEAIRYCARHRVPVIPFGTGTGQEGGVTAPQGGISIDTSRMNRILDIKAQDLDCWVEAGVTRLQLEQALRGTGLFFPVDPGADASIGGMAATGAAGTTTPLYSTMHENVAGLEVVLADGKIISTGSRARKSSAGYDLTRLFVGSEGTLGLITKVRLRLHPLPEAVIALRASFPDAASAVQAVIQVLACALPVARAELMDARILRGLRLAGLTDLPEQPVLFFEFHGSTSGLGEAAGLAGEICCEQGAVHVAEAHKTEDISQLWKLRHAVADAEKHLRPGAQVVVTDIAVPISNLPEIIAAADARLETEGLVAAMSGHMADGNLHYVLLVSRNDRQEIARAMAFKHWLAEQALSMGGTISREHGIGLGKRSLMQMAHGPALSVMAAIKQALDPLNILNPGKVLPP